MRGTVSVAAASIFLSLLCCKRSESNTTTDPAPTPAPAEKTDVCNAQGGWRFSCPSMKADEACNIRSIGSIEDRFSIARDVALNGGTWKVGDNTYSLDLATCQVNGSTAGMPCRDLHFEANLRTKSGRNVYGCWDGTRKCQATWASQPGHCSVTKD